MSSLEALSALLFFLTPLKVASRIVRVIVESQGATTYASTSFVFRSESPAGTSCSGLEVGDTVNTVGYTMKSAPMPKKKD